MIAAPRSADDRIRLIGKPLFVAKILLWNDAAALRMEDAFSHKVTDLQSIIASEKCIDIKKRIPVDDRPTPS